MKWQKKVSHANGNQKATEVAIPISEKIAFKSIAVIRDKCVNVKGINLSRGYIAIVSYTYTILEHLNILNNY